MVPEKSLIRIGILCGPTATGKSSLAVELAAQQGNIEIINADSLLVYQGMDIGTAKPSQSELKRVPHHLIDILSPEESFTAGEFKRAAESVIHSLHSRGKRALIVGGTGFYLKALLFGLWTAPAANPQVREKLNLLSSEELYQTLKTKDPESAARIGNSDRYRLIRANELVLITDRTPSELQAEISSPPDPRFRLWVIDRPNEELHSRIQVRTRLMLEQGLIQEYQRLKARFPKSRALNAIGYAQVGAYLTGIAPSGRKVRQGELGLQDEIELATRQLVKKQRTWFRNQSSKTPHQSTGFLLDTELPKLELEFKALYDPSYA